MALSTSGDGSADQQAAHRLSLSPFTINAHRMTIMGKFGLRLKNYALHSPRRLPTYDLARRVPGGFPTSNSQSHCRKNTSRESERLSLRHEWPLDKT